MNSLLAFAFAAIIGFIPTQSIALDQPSTLNIHVSKVAAAQTQRAQTRPIHARRIITAPPIPVAPIATPATTTYTVTVVPAPTVIPAPQPAPQASQPPTQPSSQIATAPSDVASQIEAGIFALSNIERQKNGIAPLVADTALAQIARAHSADMLANNYFSHTDPSGCGLSCRFAGYSYSSIGENIHWMSGYNLDAAGSAQKIVNDWMNSPSHRANILNGTFTNTGIGVAVLGSKIYSTVNFSIPR